MLESWKARSTCGDASTAPLDVRTVQTSEGDKNQPLHRARRSVQVNNHTSVSPADSCPGPPPRIETCQVAPCGAARRRLPGCPARDCPATVHVSMVSGWGATQRARAPCTSDATSMRLDMHSGHIRRSIAAKRRLKQVGRREAQSTEPSSREQPGE